jgi:integrase
MGIAINKLSDLAIKSLKPGKHFDGAGLYLKVTNATNPSKLWRMKYRFAGHEQLLSLGRYPQVSLKEARQARDDAKRQIYQGVDPSKVKAASKQNELFHSINTVEKCAQAWLTKMESSWGDKTMDTTNSLFTRDVYPFIGKKPISEVSTIELLQIVQRVEKRGAEYQAKRLLMKLTAFCRWAVVNQLISLSPAGNLRSSEILKRQPVKHREAITKDELPSFLISLDSYSGDVVVALGLELLTHTAMRPGEVRGLRWNDIDFENCIISIPSERMKMRRPFRIPLSKQVIKILEKLKQLNSNNQFVLSSSIKPEKPISDNTMNLAIRRLGYRATSHGMRSTFSTITHETQMFSSDVIEAALAHQDKNKVRGIYARTDYFEQRFSLMEWWSNYLDSIKLQKNLAMLKED